MRRFGVYLYFLFSVIAQLLLAQRSLTHSNLYGNSALRRISQIQLLLSVAPFLLGIVNVILKSLLHDPDTIENIIEWIFALMMQVFFLLTYYSWRISGFRANFSVGSITGYSAPYRQETAPGAGPVSVRPSHKPGNETLPL
jgi:heme/copper-type cytochrome/quinol oxidase subunit 1